MKRVSSGFAWFIVPATATMLLALPFASYADNISAAVFYVNAQGGTAIYSAGTVSGTGFSPGPEGGSQSSAATASFSGGVASVSGGGSTNGGVATANSSGIATLTFYFDVEQTGMVPVKITEVPLIFIGSALTSAGGPSAEALAYFETPGGQIDACSATGRMVGACGSLPPSNSGSLDYDAAPGTLNDVEVIATGSSSLGTGSWSASVDPEVEIDPTFIYASDFTIELSPNPATTPEPASLLLLGTALLVLALAARRKSKVARTSSSWSVRGISCD
jgi:hypothetical protein